MKSIDSELWEKGRVAAVVEILEDILGNEKGLDR